MPPPGTRDPFAGLDGEEVDPAFEGLGGERDLKAEARQARGLDPAVPVGPIWDDPATPDDESAVGGAPRQAEEWVRVGEMTPEQAEAERAEGGRVMGRVMRLPEVPLTGDPGGSPEGAELGPMPDPSGAQRLRNVVPAEDVRARAREADPTLAEGVVRDQTEIPAWLRYAGNVAVDQAPGALLLRAYQAGSEGSGLAGMFRPAEVVPESYDPAAVAAGGAQSLTLGHADELAGLLTGEGGYEEERDAARRRMGALEQQAPG